MAQPGPKRGARQHVPAASPAGTREGVGVHRRLPSGPAMDQEGGANPLGERSPPPEVPQRWEPRRPVTRSIGVLAGGAHPPSQAGSAGARYGSASAAYAAGVDLPRIRYFGGWSPSSRVTETTYLDLSTPPRQAGTILFQWMSSAQLGASSLEEHSDSEPDSDGPTGNSRDPQGTIFRSTATFQRPEAGSTLADLGARLGN